MNKSEIIDLLAGLLQFVVAGYAFRLKRVLGTKRAGWSLFTAFALLALLHIIQSLVLIKTEATPPILVEAMYALISLLQLAGMAHVEAAFKHRIRFEQEALHMSVELEKEVQKKTTYLTRAIEGLQAEIEERTRVQETLNMHQELLAGVERKHLGAGHTAFTKQAGMIALVCSLALPLLGEPAPAYPGKLAHVSVESLDDIGKIKLLAEQGNINAQVKIAEAFMNKRCFVEALKWYSMAAAAGHVEAGYQKGHLLLFGSDQTAPEQRVAANPAEGLKLIYPIATKGHLGACYDMGLATAVASSRRKRCRRMKVCRRCCAARKMISRWNTPATVRK